MMRAILVVLAMVGMLAVGGGQAGAAKPGDTEYIDIYFTGWDHSDLTVAIQAGAGVDADTVAAVNEAIAIWSETLLREFGGAVTLTNVTGDPTAEAQADIRLVLTSHGPAA